MSSSADAVMPKCRQFKLVSAYRELRDHSDAEWRATFLCGSDRERRNALPLEPSMRETQNLGIPRCALPAGFTTHRRAGSLFSLIAQRTRQNRGGGRN